MYLVNEAKAVSGFMTPPAGLKWYSSSILQTKRSFVCSQLELIPLGNGSSESRFRLCLALCVAFLFSVTLSDHWGP